MKKTLLLSTIVACLLAMVTMQGCSSDKGSAADLLRTVPSSAAGVAVVNLDALKEKCKDYDSFVSKENDSRNLGQILSLCLDAESGVDISTGVIFVEGYNTVFTAIADKPEEFMSCVKQRMGLEFSEIDGVSIADGRIAVKGTQLWVSLAGAQLNPKMLESWLSLSEAKSYLSTDGGKELAETDKDVAFNVDFDTIINLYSDGDFSRQAQSRIILSTLFDDLSRLSGFVKLTKTGPEVEVDLLNSKGQASRFNLDAEKVDVKTLASIGGRCGTLIGLGISKKMIAQINKAASSFGGGLPKMYADALEPINGCCGIAVSADTPAMSGVLTTKEGSAQALTSLLAGDAKIRREGKLLFFTTGGEMTGDIDVSASAEMLKGALCGCVTDASPVKSWLGTDFSSKGLEQIDKTVLGLYPAGEGVTIKIKIKMLFQSIEK